MFRKQPQRKQLAVALAALVSMSALPALAQDAAAQPAQEDAKTLDTVMVTGATKRGPQNVQDVPAAITALGPEQLDELNFQNLTSLSYTMPNVQLDDIGTLPGYANFSIRGLGINSSIPSIDPTVGVFVDGVYMGIAAGMLTDNFDIQNIEVLRGPQGVLFGRNVTGGAILINTRAPTDEFKFDARLGAETGLKTIADATIRGPLVKGLLDGKLAVYGSHDEGWFTNQFNGKKFGGGDTRVVRAALRFTPADGFENTLRLEHGTADGDGPASQNPALFSTDTHDVTANADQFYDTSWSQLFNETTIGVPFGDGTITNIFGWRKYNSRTLIDVDSTNLTGFHSRARVDQDQLSNELRYAGTFGNFDVTTGYFMFQQHQLYMEARQIIAPTLRVGGGDGFFESWGTFLAVDWHVSDAFTVNLGARYSSETKTADVSRILPLTALTPGRGPGGGNIDAGTLNPDFPGLSKSWSDVSPKIGFQWKPGDNTHVYGFWTKGFRSGGVNFRHTSAVVPVEFFDAEEQRSVELGLKQEFPSLDARLNVAVFQNKIGDIQREDNNPDPISGVVQIIRNVGDVTVRGAEAEGQIALGAGFTVTAQVGYTHNKYDSLRVDLNGICNPSPTCTGSAVIGVIDATDYALKLPRAAPWTYGVSLLHDLPIGAGNLSSRISYNHRDAEYYSDNNRGVLNESNQLSANFSYNVNQHWSVSLYGDNLLDETTWGGDTLLPDAPATVAPFFGGDGPLGPRPIPALRPLARGRVVGAELRYTF